MGTAKHLIGRLLNPALAMLNPSPPKRKTKRGAMIGTIREDHVQAWTSRFCEDLAKARVWSGLPASATSNEACANCKARSKLL